MLLSGSALSKDQPGFERLGRTGVLAYRIHERRSLFWKYAARGLEDVPADPLRTGRSRQGTIVSIVGAVPRNEAELTQGELKRSAHSGFRGNVRPDRAEARLPPAASEQYSENRKLSACTLVNEVGLERKLLTPNPILTGTVEMELDQFEPKPVGRQRATGRHVDLDRVSVVHDSCGLAGVAELDGGEVRLHRRDDVDRRLIAFLRAKGELIRELRPVIRPR